METGSHRAGLRHHQSLPSSDLLTQGVGPEDQEAQCPAVGEHRALQGHTEQAWAQGTAIRVGGVGRSPSGRLGCFLPVPMSWA